MTRGSGEHGPQGMFVGERRRRTFQLNRTWAAAGGAAVCVAIVMVVVFGGGSSKGSDRLVDAGAVEPAATSPTVEPSTSPTVRPTASPTVRPTASPTVEPTTNAPSVTRQPTPTVTATARAPQKSGTATTAPTRTAAPKETRYQPSPAEIAAAEAAVARAKEDVSVALTDPQLYGCDLAVLRYRVKRAERTMLDLKFGPPGMRHHDLDVEEAEVYLAAAKVHLRLAVSEADRMEAKASVAKWVERLMDLQS